MYEFLKYSVSHVMTTAPVTIGPQTPLAHVEAIFEEHDFNGLPVLEESGRFVGFLTKLDLLKAFAFTSESKIPAYDDIIRQPAERVMTREPRTVEADLPLTKLLQQMVDTGHKSFPVVDAHELLGMVAREDVIRALRRAVAGQSPSHRG